MNSKASEWREHNSDNQKGQPMNYKPIRKFSNDLLDR